MTDFLWPTAVIPARSEVVLRDLSSRFVSPFTGTTRTYSRPGGELFGLTLTLPPMKDAQAAALRGLLAQLRGGVHRVWCKDHSYVRRGSFPATELLSNNTFANGTTGWTDVYGTSSVKEGVLRFSVGSHTASQYPDTRNYFSVANGIATAARAFFQNVETSVDIGIYYSDGTGATSVFNIGDGLKYCSMVTTGGSGAFLLYIRDTSVVGDSFEVPYTSVARCALVKGASQTGSRLLIDALPTSTDGLLLVGDQVQIGEELLVVRAVLNSNSSGEGYLYLHRPPRTTPADNAPVIIHEPMGLFMLAEGENGWMNEPGRLLNATVNLIEAPR